MEGTKKKILLVCGVKLETGKKQNKAKQKGERIETEEATYLW